jgi:hypothetical protein
MENKLVKKKNLVENTGWIRGGGRRGHRGRGELKKSQTEKYRQ